MRKVQQSNGKIKTGNNGESRLQIKKLLEGRKMTKKGYMPKLLAMLIGAIMCLCMATVAFTAAGVVGAKAEGDDRKSVV